MPILHQIYRCAMCGNIVETVHGSDGQLVCCGQPMNWVSENTTDAAQEKHLPVIEKTNTGIKVRVGSYDHPMEEEHYIEWIEIIFDGRSGKQFLKPGDKPEAAFNIQPEQLEVRAYCNQHGLWKSVL